MYYLNLRITHVYGDECTLKVTLYRRSDQGSYTVIAKNCVGKDMVTVNLKVLDKPGPPEGPLKVKNCLPYYHQK